MTFEYIAAGRDADPRWRRLLTVALVVIALLAGAALWGTARVHEQANADLASAVTDATSDARSGEAVVLSTLQYASPTIWSTMVGEDVRAGLRTLVQRSAGDVVRTLDRTRASVEGTFVLPWDASQRQAKAAVLDLVDEHRARFEQIASDAAAIGPVFSSPAPSDDTARALLRASGAKPDDGR